MQRTIDLHSAKTFLTIAETGSFTKAARLVGRTQSAVSMQIQRLEDLLGGELFDRGGAGLLGLSERGEQFLPLAKKLIRDNQAILDLMRSADLTGRVRLGVCDDFAEHLLAGVLRRFRRAHAQINVEVTTDLSVPLLDAFDNGALDLVVAKRLPDNKSEHLHILTQADLTWVSAPNFLYRDQRPLRLVLFPERMYPREILTSALKRADIPWVATATCYSLSALRAAVAAGIGVSAIARNAVFGDLNMIDGTDLPALPRAQTALFWKPETLAPAVERLRSAIIGNTMAIAG
ncbi:DNA-binding transcriptional LysR family regulator [Nitrobacteraceae bacterium AZCC 1564]